MSFSLQYYTSIDIVLSYLTLVSYESISKAPNVKLLLEVFKNCSKSLQNMYYFTLQVPGTQYKYSFVTIQNLLFIYSLYYEKTKQVQAIDNFTYVHNISIMLIQGGWPTSQSRFPYVILNKRNVYNYYISIFLIILTVFFVLVDCSNLKNLKGRSKVHKWPSLHYIT